MCLEGGVCGVKSRFLRAMDGGDVILGVCGVGDLVAAGVPGTGVGVAGLDAGGSGPGVKGQPRPSAVVGLVAKWSIGVVGLMAGEGLD